MSRPKNVDMAGSGKSNGSIATHYSQSSHYSHHSTQYATTFFFFFFFPFFFSPLLWCLVRAAYPCPCLPLVHFFNLKMYQHLVHGGAKGGKMKEASTQGVKQSPSLAILALTWETIRRIGDQINEQPSKHRLPRLNNHLNHTGPTGPTAECAKGAKDRGNIVMPSRPNGFNVHLTVKIVSRIVRRITSLKRSGYGGRTVGPV